MPEETDLRQYSLEELRDLCKAETGRYLRQVANDPRFCFELFRLALVELRQEAWEIIYDLYSGQVTRWIRRHSSYAALAEEEQFFVNRAFENFWKAFASNPARFNQFPELKHLLQFLQVCTHNLIIDHVRSDARRRVEGRLERADWERYNPGPGVEDATFSREQARSCWQAIRAKLKGEQEYRILYARFVLDFKPSQIVKRYPGEFEDVKAVYRILERVMLRLRRDDELRELCL